MLFYIVNAGEDFATVEGGGSSSWKLFERYARADHHKDLWFNNPSHYFCTFMEVQTEDETIVLLFVADRQVVAATPSARKLLKGIYRFFKRQESGEAKFIASCCKRLLKDNR